ncbi:uncharacterized protein LOC132739151 [Ruditapes philippinarum]|uniref:uncharacterized protein LOC132739151 n=1 Tax=Ruditapes philippinarum TaxID=129788 RepID=UPI00295BE947|nr:uncharacterized protein LOC132739151 [Ruditapes philippinarum]
MDTLRKTLTVLFWGLLALTIVDAGPFSWMKKDKFDEIMDKMTAVTAENCHSKPRSELELPKESVSHVPVYNKLLSNVYFANRSMLLHMHNLAFNRAFYYSFIYQRMNTSDDFEHQPGLMYLYMSAAADVSASPGWVNGSSLLFDNNCTYPNWYTTVDFNTTLSLFGPRAWRADDYNEPQNYLRESTNRTINVEDYATGTVPNYTDESYKYAPYTRYEYDPTDARQEKPLFWWPDSRGYKDSLRKFTYSVGIKFSNQTGKFTRDDFEGIPFFGPPQPGQTDTDITLPVLFTKPYFDCGRSNRWITTMSAPVVDFTPRYSSWIHLRRPRFVAVVGIDGVFERIDINQCPFSEGNDPPNMFAGTHRCRETTMCEPISGYGFRRGGYQCVCLPGYYYPSSHDGPFQGWEIEQATLEEYEHGFDCLKAEGMQVVPNQMPEFVRRKKRSTLYTATKKDEFLLLTSPMLEQSASPKLRLVANRKRRSADGSEQYVAATYRKQFVKRYDGETKKFRKKREAFEYDSWEKMSNIRQRFFNVTKESCRSKECFELYLPGDAGYGVERQFEAQGRTALRLSHFLSNFLQNVDEYEQFGNLKGDRGLNETHIFGEVLATVMGDFKVLGAGAYFDQYKFQVSPPVNTTDPRYSNAITRELFGPFSWRIQNPSDGLDAFRAIDSAGIAAYRYIDEPWFRKMKQRWATNFHSLKKFIDKQMIRSSPNSTSSIRFEHYPITYSAPSYEDGEWSRPEFKCDGYIDDWVSTYTVPFFGLNSDKSQIEFKGVIRIHVKLKYLDINQCPADIYVANTFKNTAKCDFRSQYCVPLPGKGFEQGAYKCVCRQGYVYPFTDLSWFFHGQTMEEEYSKKSLGEPNRYDTLRCRIAGADAAMANVVLIAFTTLSLLLWKH